MAKRRGGQSNGSNRPPMASSHNPVSLRTEASGLKPSAKCGGNTNPKSMLKLQHLQNLAVWTGGEGSAPSLAAFFGRRLAAVGESLAVPSDPSLLSCQRCETILQPGFNCTVRIEKNRRNSRRRRRGKQPNTTTQNKVVYTCHFCSQRNLKRGTPKHHLKDINPKPKSSPKPKPVKKSLLQTPINPEAETSVVADSDTILKMEVESAAMEEDVLPLESSATPLPKTATLLGMKRKKRNRSVSKRPAEPESSPSIAEASGGASTKRRRKSWTSLKEIATEGNSDQSRSITSLKLPFFG